MKFPSRLEEAAGCNPADRTPRSAGRSLVARRTLFAKRPNRFLDALELTILTQQRVDAEPRHGFLSPDRLEAGDGEIDVIGVTFANEVGQDLSSRKVDFDNACRLQDDQPCLLRRGLQRVQDVSPEMVGVEKRQWRLKSRDNDAGLSFAGKIGARRPPDRRSMHPFEYLHPGAGRAPYAVQERKRDTDSNTLFDRENDDGRRCQNDQKKFTQRLPENHHNLADTDDPQRNKQQNAPERRVRNSAEKPGAECQQYDHDRYGDEAGELRPSAGFANDSGARRTRIDRKCADQSRQDTAGSDAYEIAIDIRRLTGVR